MSQKKGGGVHDSVSIFAGDSPRSLPSVPGLVQSLSDAPPFLGDLRHELCLVCLGNPDSSFSYVKILNRICDVPL